MKPLQAGGPQHLGSEEHKGRIMVVMGQARSKEAELVFRAFKNSQRYPWEKGLGSLGMGQAFGGLEEIHTKTVTSTLEDQGV